MERKGAGEGFRENRWVHPLVAGPPAERKEGGGMPAPRTPWTVAFRPLLLGVRTQQAVAVRGDGNQVTIGEKPNDPVDRLL